jgi:hypothetical protein
MNEVKVQYFKPLAVLLILAGLPVSIALTAISAWVTWLILMNPLPAGMNTYQFIGVCIMFPLIMVIGAKSVWFILRYGTETLFTVFRLSERGINIENRRYGNLEIGWGDIDSAIYDRPLKVIVLKSSKLASPIAIVNNAQYQSNEFKEAVSLIKNKCTNRWKEKWL